MTNLLCNSLELGEQLVPLSNAENKISEKLIQILNHQKILLKSNLQYIDAKTLMRLLKNMCLLNTDIETDNRHRINWDNLHKVAKYKFINKEWIADLWKYINESQIEFEFWKELPIVPGIYNFENKSKEQYLCQPNSYALILENKFNDIDQTNQEISNEFLVYELLIKHGSAIELNTDIENISKINVTDLLKKNNVIFTLEFG